MNILLGRSVFKGDPEPNFPIENETVNAIFAPTKYGKSVIMDSLIMGEAEHKPYIFIIDYRGEHENLKYPNCEAPRPNCLSNLKVIRNMGFLIEDFKKSTYWSSMGFAPAGSKALADMALKVDEHNNDPEVFYQMIKDSTTQSAGQMARKASMLDNFKPRIFMTPDDDYRTYVNHWGEYIKQHKRVLLNLNLERADVSIAQTFISVVLDQIKEYVIRNKITPIAIFIEESDILAPEGEERPLSSHLIEEFSLKLQRHGVSLYLLSQNVNRLQRDVRSNVKHFILGRLAKNDIFGDMTQGLVWDRTQNYREFLWTNNADKKIKFIPFDSPVDYERRK